MSYNVQDKLTFIVEIQKRGDVSQITKIANDINAALSNATKGQRAFTTEAVSSSTKVNAALNKTVTAYNSFGKAVTGSYSPITQFNAAVGKSASIMNTTTSATQKLGSGYAVLGNNARGSIGVLTQFDTTVRRNATTMNAGVASANAYSAIFKTIPAAVQAGTAAINANTAALTQNTAKAQQYGAVMRTVTSSTAAQSNAFIRLNSALATNIRQTDSATKSEERRNQSIISNVRGMSTMVLGFAMLNNSMVDYNLNQQSMADLNEKVASLTERLATAIEEYGEGSFQATQAQNALEKAQRAVRYETREMTNQLQNQMFLYILIGQEIASNAIPAFLRWGETVASIRNGFNSFLGVLGRARGSITEFGNTLAVGSAAGTVFSSRMQQIPTDVDGVSRSIGGMNTIIMDSSGRMKNHGDIVSGLGQGYNLYGKAVQDASTQQTRAAGAASRLRSGFVSLGATLGGAGGAGLIGATIGAAVALGLYSSNAAGTRDNVNAFGESVGKLHPLLEAMGQGLVGIAGALGLTGESISQVDHHFAEAGESFHDFTTEWHNTLEAMKNDTNVAVATIGQTLSTLGTHANSLGKMATGQPLVDVNASREEQFAQYKQLRADSRPFGLLNDLVAPLPSDEQLQKDLDAYLASLDKEKKAADALREIDKSKLTTDALMDFGDPKNKNEMPASAESSADYIAYLKEQSALYKELEENNQTYTSAILDQTDALDNATIRGEIARSGKQRFAATMGEELIALQESAYYWDAYSAALDKPIIQQAEMVRGMVAQHEAGVKQRAESFQLIGVYQKLQEQVTTGTAIEDAYRTGVMETNIALLERAKSIANEIGSLDAYNNAIVDGTVQQLAFAEGVNTQREALYQSVEAASNAQGQLSQLNQQLADGTRQAAAFQQGYDETALSIKMGNVEIAAAQGAFNAWADAASSGEIASQAFQRGILAQNDALKQSYETMHESAGALQQFQKQLATGLPQGIAFTQTLLNMGLAAEQMQVKLAEATATLMFNQSQFKSSLNETKDAIVDLNGVIQPTIANLVKFSAVTATAFQTGRNQAYEWINGMIEAAHATAGLTLETTSLAYGIVGEMVPAFRNGVQATQEFVALFLKVPEAIAKVRDELKGIFDGVIDGFADAMREGESELDDAIDEFSDKLGIKFNKGVTEALEFHAGTDMFGDLTKEFGALIIGIGDNLDEDSFNHLKDQVQGRLENVMDKVMDDLPEGPLKDSVRTSMTNIMNIFKNAEVGDMGSPTAITNMIGGIGMELMNLDGLTNNFQTTWNDLMAAMLRGDLEEVNRLMQILNTDINKINTVTFDPITAQFARIQTSIQLTSDEIQEQIDKVRELGEAYNGLEFNKANTDAYFAELPTEGGVLNNVDGKIQQGATPVQLDETPLKPGQLKPLGASGTSTDPNKQSGIEQIQSAAAAAEAAIKQLEATAKTSAAVITQQFASMAMNIVAVLGEIPKASVGMFQLIAAAASGTIPLVAAQFTAMGVAASAELGKIPVAAVANFELIAAAASGSIPVVAAQFTAMGVAASTELGKIPIAAVANFQLIAAAASGNIPVVAAQFTAMATAALTELGKIPIGAINQFALIAGAVTQALPSVEAEFAKMTLAATTEFGKIIQAAVTQFKLAGDQARQVTVGVTTHFNQAAANAQGVLSGMEGDAEESFGAMGDSAVAVPEGVDTHFGKAADDGIALMDALERSVVANMEAMAKKAGDVASAIDKIGQSADTVKGKVDSLARAIASLQDKTVTITYRIRTVGSAPSGAGAGRSAFKGTVLMGEGGYLDALDAVDRTVVTGESGSEFVRTINKFGHMKEQIVDNIKSFKLGAGEAIQVQPLEGQYATDFKQKHGNIINMASGQNWYYQNQNGVINTNIPGLLPDNTPGSGIGNSQTSPFSDVAPFVPKNGSTIGKPYSDGTDTVFTADPYNRNLTASEWGKSYLGGGRWYDPMTGQYYTGMGGTPTPGTGGGPGTGGPGNGGTGPTQIVTTPDGRVRIEQGNGKQSIIIDGKEMLPQQQMSAFSDSVDQFSETVDQQQGSNANGLNGANGANGTSSGGVVITGQNGTNGANGTPGMNGANGSTSYTDSRGNNFNFQNDSNSNSNVFGNNGTNVGNDPLGSSSDTGAGNNTNQNFGNGKYYRSTNGVVETNMTPAEIEEMNRRFPFLHLDPSKGVGGGSTPGGGGTPVGKIWNLDLPSPTSNPNAAIPFNYENDPMGWHNYGLIPDPLFRERADRPDVIGGTPGSPPGNGPNQPGFPFDFSWIADLLRQILGAIRLGRNTQVNIGSRNIIDIVQGGIMDGFSNFK